MSLTIMTNKRERGMWHWNDLPKKVQKDFDYITEDDAFTPRFVRFKGEWYDALDTQRITTCEGAFMGWDIVVKPDNPLYSWHAIISETFFSGILFRFIDDDHVVVGTYYS